METIREPARDIPIRDKVDVIVVGGGPAGIGAALASARNGAKTVLIEKFGGLGGQQTQGLNSVFSRVDPELHNGIVQEVLQRLMEGGAMRRPDDRQTRQNPMRARFIARYGEENIPKRLLNTNVGWWGGEKIFDLEYYKYLLDIMMQEAGVNMYLHSFAASTIRDGNTLKGIITEGKEGRRAVLGKAIIDTTGDGDIAWKCGAPVMDDTIPLGRRKGRHMGSLTAFYLGGVDVGKWLEFRKAHMDEWGQMYGGHRMVREAREKGAYIRGDSIILSPLHSVHGGGRIWVMNPMYGPQEDHHLWMAEEQTNLEVSLRKQAFAVQNLLKQQIPGFEKCFVEKTANYPVTTMHRIIGDHVITVAEMREGKTFEDSIAINNQPPDIWEVAGRFGYEILPHDVPYRSIVSKEVDNLLAAGTTISCGLFTDGGLRYCTPSICTGQAAGTATALAAKNNISPKDLDMNLLKETLRKQGAHVSVKDVPEEAIEPYRFIKKISVVYKKNPDIKIDEEEIGKY